MANTLTRTVIQKGSNTAVIYLTLSSDGSEETDYVVFDASADTENPVITSGERIMEVWGSIGAAATARAWLEFDAATDVLAMNLPIMQDFHADFRPMGGLKDTSGATPTGDITLTTTGLENGDKMHLVLVVKTR